MKKLAAEAAVTEVESGMVVGLGTGSTVDYFLQALAEKTKDGLTIIGVPTSDQTAKRAHELGIPLLENPGDVESIDLAVDGTDEIDENGNLIKGGGGALTREKVVAFCSNRVVIVADASKIKKTLGAFPLPVEVTHFGWKAAASHIRQLGASHVHLRIKDGSPFISDNGNLILDADFGCIADPIGLSSELNAFPAVLENGLFCNSCSTFITADENGDLKWRSFS